MSDVKFALYMNWICCVYLFLTCILLNKTRRRRGSIEPGVGMWVSYLNREKKLDKLVGQRPVAPVAPKGLYLYGNVGSGKLPESYTCTLKIGNFYYFFFVKSENYHELFTVIIFYVFWMTIIYHLYESQGTTCTQGRQCWWTCSMGPLKVLSNTGGGFTSMR